MQAMLCGPCEKGASHLENTNEGCEDRFAHQQASHKLGPAHTMLKDVRSDVNCGILPTRTRAMFMVA